MIQTQTTLRYICRNELLAIDKPVCQYRHDYSSNLRKLFQIIFPEFGMDLLFERQAK